MHFAGTFIRLASSSDSRYNSAFSFAFSTYYLVVNDSLANLAIFKYLL